MNFNGSLILMQAIGAAMRGESPQKFMKNLANQHPQLRRMNLDDLQTAAQTLAQQSGVSVDAVTNQLNEVMNPLVGGSR